MPPPSEELKTQEAEPALETASEPATVLAADSVRVLIVDDHPMVREGLAGILERHRMQITGLAANGRQGIEMYFSQRPDVMLLDLRLPDQSGFDVIRAVLKSDPVARIVVLSSAQGDASIHTAIALGVCGYLLKGIDGATLAQQVRHVAQGGKSLSPETAEQLARFVSSRKLSDRELEVLGLISKGKSNKEIGKILFVTDNTVKMHVKNILSKLEASDRTQAVVIGIQRGLLDA
jgi:DNA-binding NarL/FixJ family response regulator